MLPLTSCEPAPETQAAPATFWYLGTPYSKYPAGLDAAYKLACRQRGLLLQAGVPCFSPIAHSHGVATECDLDPRDLSVWLPSEAPIMAAACGLIVCMAASWRESVGLRHEIDAFEACGKPVVYMAPGVVPERLARAAVGAG